jgi:hypothetical protein
MQPFWADLALDYRQNQQHVDSRIAQVAALGDSVVPLLLEKLQPAEGGPLGRHLAGNCRRVLEKLDPASFQDALIELLHGPSETARVEAIRLLGATGTPRAAQVLGEHIMVARGDERVYVLRALAMLRAKEPAEQIVGLLGSDDREIRAAVLEYLIAARPASAIDTVAEALQVEKTNNLLPSYVEFFAAAATGSDTAAKALLPLLDRERLDWNDTRRLVAVLATVAPKDHDPTCRRMHEILDSGDTGSLALQAGLTLKALGDSSGLKKLNRTLGEQLVKRKKDASLYELRGNLNLATESWNNAIDDYEKVVELSQSTAMTRRVQLQLIRCEAHRHRWTEMLKRLKETDVGLDEIQALARDDAAVQEALQQDKIRAYVQALPKERPPASAPGGTTDR